MWISIAALLGFCLLSRYGDTQWWGEPLLSTLARMTVVMIAIAGVGTLLAS
jgi:hypothetical protein